MVTCIALNVLLRSSTAAEADTPPGNPAVAAQAVNALGLELLARGTAADDNALLSPYSIQTALAMTFAGAAGDTRAEMAKVLHYPGEEATLHRSFAALHRALEEVARQTAARAEKARERGGPSEPVVLTVANRLFGQGGYAFRAPFLSLVKDTYQAPFQPLDFARDPLAATREINGWVEQQTRQRIRDRVRDEILRSDEKGLNSLRDVPRMIGTSMNTTNAADLLAQIARIQLMEQGNAPTTSRTARPMPAPITNSKVGNRVRTTRATCARSRSPSWRRRWLAMPSSAS